MKYSHTLLILLLTFLVSACVATVTTVVIDQSLDQYAQELEESDTYLNLSQERPDPLPGTYEEALEYMQEQSGDIAYFTRSAVGVDLEEEDILGRGAVVTTDGWVLVARGDGAARYSIESTAWVNGDAYDVEEIVEYGPFDMVRLASVQGLEAFAFGAADQVERGQRIFGFAGMRDIVVTTLQNDVYIPVGSAYLLQDEQRIGWWKLQDEVEEAIFVNAAGGLLAVSDSDGLVYPIDIPLPWLQAVIRGEEYVAPSIGVSVRWLDHLFVKTANVQSGVLVVASAQDALLPGDVLVRVAGQSITETVSLSDILAQRRVGDVVEVVFLRNEQERSAEVVLEEADLLY